VRIFTEAITDYSENDSSILSWAILAGAKRRRLSCSRVKRFDLIARRNSAAHTR
jgi:hypothetical protein